MKIVHITYLLTFGGIETMLVNIANEQVRQGHHVEIIVVERGAIEPTLREKLAPSIKIHCANRKRNKNDLMAVLRINWMLIKAQPDAIHIHSSGLIRSILLPCYCNITCATLHALPFEKNIVAIERVPKIFSISETVQKELKEKYGVDSMVVPNGIHPEIVKTRQNTADSKLFRIVMVSRLEHERKGQDILIDAIAELKLRGITNISVDFIGDGESREFLVNRCNEYCLGEYIHFLGAQTQEYVFEHLADYNLFVQPSRNEGFALTVAEAMAARVPVLVASGQGPEEVIENGKCGYIFINGDAKDCAEKIAWIIKNGEDTAMTERACERVWKLYNVEVTAQTYLDHYIWKQ